MKEQVTQDFIKAITENDIDYSKPILYNNCANPITLCYVNSNIKKIIHYLKTFQILLTMVQYLNLVELLLTPSLVKLVW